MANQLSKQRKEIFICAGRDEGGYHCFGSGDTPQEAFDKAEGESTDGRVNSLDCRFYKGVTIDVQTKVQIVEK